MGIIELVGDSLYLLIESLNLTSENQDGLLFADGLFVIFLCL